MLARPRSVEREVAAHLTQMSAKIGASPVERIPVLGRTGPDLTTNEIGLVIDVKSRLSVPQGYFGKEPCYIGEMIVVPLDQLLALDGVNIAYTGKPSVVVSRWYTHMDEWTRANMPDGISALVLHRPKMPIGQSELLFHSSNLEVLKCKMLKLSSTRPART